MHDGRTTRKSAATTTAYQIRTSLTSTHRNTTTTNTSSHTTTTTTTPPPHPHRTSNILRLVTHTGHPHVLPSLIPSLQHRATTNIHAAHHRDHQSRRRKVAWPTLPLKSRQARTTKSRTGGYQLTTSLPGVLQSMDNAPRIIRIRDVYKCGETL